MMKRDIINIFLASVAGIALLDGCVNQETLNNPTVQKGAAIGAVSGAVIGGNVGDRSGTNIALGALAGAVAGGAVGQAVDNSNPKPVQDGGWQ